MAGRGKRCRAVFRIPRPRHSRSVPWLRCGRVRCRSLFSCVHGGHRTVVRSCRFRNEGSTRGPDGPLVVPLRIVASFVRSLCVWFRFWFRLFARCRSGSVRFGSVLWMVYSLCLERGNMTLWTSLPATSGPKTPLRKSPAGSRSELYVSKAAWVSRARPSPASPPVP